MFDTFADSDIKNIAFEEKRKYHIKSEDTFLPLDNLKKHGGRIFFPKSRLLKDFSSIRNARDNINRYAEKVLKRECKVNKSVCQYTDVSGLWVEVK